MGSHDYSLSFFPGWIFTSHSQSLVIHKMVIWSDTNTEHWFIGWWLTVSWFKELQCYFSQVFLWLCLSWLHDVQNMIGSELHVSHGSAVISSLLFVCHCSVFFQMCSPSVSVCRSDFRPGHVQVQVSQPRQSRANIIMYALWIWFLSCCFCYQEVSGYIKWIFFMGWLKNSILKTH